ncbi:Alpha/Beta hydrolase protein [Microdochium trichocladiopsis]|uniref:feruloyl esterase n=1 Tax=Microdochium trichocladiopsis TaxID=1682393 RepID=A0A9P8Y9I8_9PEZI|nr:Alpha/Beta hydrolase protein [Microdochium trichocladiopsis]KAH7031416.1 Alpha/Beta hydrolase protein [Microdochium trichocladiopsis]
MFGPQLSSWLLAASLLQPTIVAGAAVGTTTPSTTTITPGNHHQDNVKRTTAGCGKTHYFNGLTHFHSLTSSGRERKYSIQLPGSYDKDAAYPVVLGFHGSESIGTWFELDTKMSEDRFSAGKIMVYPDGVDGSWAGASYSAVSVDEDLQFVSDLLDTLRAEYCIDDSRIYATGMSNGAGFVNILACSPRLSAHFAAFAPHSGAYYYLPSGSGASSSPPPAVAQCQPARTPLPILSFHGGADTSVPYAGGTGSGGELPPLTDWLADWAERNGCGAETVEDGFGGDVHHHRWSSCGASGGGGGGGGGRGGAGGDDQVVMMEHYKIDSMGHCWASTEINFSQIAAGQWPTHIDASSIIMAFFDRFQKP